MNTCAIRIPKLRLFGYHGCYDIEKTERQEFVIDMEVKFSYEDENIEVESIPINRINKLIKFGEITDAKTIALLLMAFEIF